jgi:hypothetical protein
MWSALSDGRMSLSFTITDDPRQCSHSQVRVFYCLRFQTSPFLASYDSQGYGGGIRSPLPTLESTRLSHSASLSWNKALICGLRPDFYYCQTLEGFLSDERTELSFTVAAGYCKLFYVSLLREITAFKGSSTALLIVFTTPAIPC